MVVVFSLLVGTILFVIDFLLLIVMANFTGMHNLGFFCSCYCLLLLSLLVLLVLL